MKKQKVSESELVNCAVCEVPVSVRTAWFDPYNKKMRVFEAISGAYVHLECLSETRRNEIASYKINDEALLIKIGTNENHKKIAP